MRTPTSDVQEIMYSENDEPAQVFYTNLIPRHFESIGRPWKGTKIF